MKILYSSRFKKDYRSLPLEEKKQFRKKAKLMIENLKHPSLRIKKIQGRKGIFELLVMNDELRERIVSPPYSLSELAGYAKKGFYQTIEEEAVIKLKNKIIVKERLLFF